MDLSKSRLLQGSGTLIGGKAGNLEKMILISSEKNRENNGLGKGKFKKEKINHSCKT